MWIRTIRSSAQFTYWRRQLRDWATGPRGRWDGSRAETWLRHSIEILLSVLIMGVMASFWRPHAHSLSTAPHKYVQSLTQLTPAEMTEKIIADHLFGHRPSHTGTVAVIDQSVTVDGITYATKASESRVILTLHGKTNVYKINQVLTDGETLTAIGPSAIELTANDATRHLNLPRYGNPDSEGPAAYAALLHGIGLSAPQTQPSLATVSRLGTSNPTLPFSAPSTLAVSRFTSMASSGRPVQIPATATPLEQLQALRAQLIH